MTTLIRRAAQLVGVTAPDVRRKAGRQMGELGVVPGGALVIEEGRIAWLGPDRDLPSPLPQAEQIDAAGCVVLPGFIDSHTHLIWAGSRPDEFEQRLQG